MLVGYTCRTVRICRWTGDNFPSLMQQSSKHLKPEITAQPQASTIYAGGDGSVSFSAEGKYLISMEKDGVDLTGETNATLNINDANATSNGRKLFSCGE